eukprot:Tamp_09781.p1 GENE.Tamp_09781~~Tamp_09781.p1  ORF type:complete len:519 (+),score=86.17 Tamp_09781:150-1706(+)
MHVAHQIRQGGGHVQSSKQLGGANEPPKKMTREEKLQASLEKSQRAARDLTWGRFYVQAWFWCFVSLLVWLGGGTMWYCLWHEWPFWTGLYYLMQATMSIGFGFPTEEDVCRRMEDNPDGFAFTLARYWVDDENEFPGPEAGGRGGCTASEISKAMTTFWVVYFAAIAAASVGILIGKLVNPPGAWYKNLIQEAKLQKMRQQAEESPGWIDDIWIGVKMFWFQALWFKAMLLLSFWCGLGVLFAMLSAQRMRFWTAIYFAVTSISTAGLEGLKPFKYSADEDGNIEMNPYTFYTSGDFQYQFAFVAIYTLIGVPLFGWAVSAVGAVFADNIMVRDSAITLHQAFTPEEFQLMKLLGKGKLAEGADKNSITLHKFVECQLLRLGKVSVDELYEIKARFVELDLDNSLLLEEEELTDTGCNLAAEEGKLDPQAMAQALQYMENKDTELWASYMEGGKTTNAHRPVISSPGPLASPAIALPGFETMLLGPHGFVHPMQQVNGFHGNLGFPGAQPAPSPFRI